MARTERVMLEHRKELGVRVAVGGFARWRGFARYQEKLGLSDTVVLSDPDRGSTAAAARRIGRRFER